MRETKAFLRAKAAIERRNNPPPIPVKVKKEVPKKHVKNYSYVKKPTETALHAKLTARIKSLQKLVIKRNNQIFHLHRILRDRKTIVPVFVALRLVDEWMVEKYGIRTSDVYILQQGDLEDIPFTSQQFDVYALNRLVKAGFMKRITMKEKPFYITMPNGKIFLKDLTKEVGSKLAPVLKLRKP